MFVRRQKKIVFFLLLLLTATPLIRALPSVVRRLTVSGTAAVSSRELLGWLSTKPSLVFSEPILYNDVRTIIDQYRRRGYIDLQLSSPEITYSADSAWVDITLRISEGRQTVVGSFLITGNQKVSAPEIVGKFDVQPGKPLDERLLEQDIDGLLTGYEKMGFPFAQCRVERMEMRAGEEVDSLDIILRVDEGERLTIDEIRVEGNRETDASVVVRETRLSLGEVYSPVKVNAIKQRLNRLNIFSSVSDPELYVRRTRGGLLIKVQEGSTNTFDGIIGYIPATSTGQEGYLTGLASVSMRNLFGTGRKLSVRWQKEDRFSQELGVRYVEPWILSLPMNLGGGFFQRQQDTSYVRRVLDAKAELMLSENLSIGILFGSESVIPSSDTTVRRAFRSSTLSFGGDVQYDDRDDIYSPTRGGRYHTDYQYGRKRIADLGKSVAIQRLGVDLEFYASMFSRQVIAIGLHGRELQSGQPEESEMYRFGGTNSLRGYRENQFLGSRIVWSNLEYRFLLARRSFFMGFVDTGYYLRPADDVHGLSQSEAFKYGYGIGVRLDTPLGNMGVSFALGQGDTFSNGKIHFGLINEF